MKYKYTWSHILLFAKMCDKRESFESVTSEWVHLVEDHHTSTLPFTLWPLTYRTSSVVSSSAMESPTLLSSTFLGVSCEVVIYKCNEVVVICIRADETSTLSCELCDLLSDISFDGKKTKHTQKSHSTSKEKPLVPCTIAHCYWKIKDKVIERFNEMLLSSAEEEIKCVICVGYRDCSLLASCLANDLGSIFETEKEFMDLDSRSVDVDYIGFADHPNVNDKYWDNLFENIDKQITVWHVGDTRKGLSNTVYKNNSSEIQIGGISEKIEKNSKRGQFKNKLPSLFRRDSVMETSKSHSENNLIIEPSVVDIDQYIETVIKKIYIY